jgi:hypothetical protein
MQFRLPHAICNNHIKRTMITYLKVIWRMSNFIIILVCSAFLLSGCAKDQEKISTLAESAYARGLFEKPLPPKHFQSDGCSCWFDGDWVDCCVNHDLVYWMGGTRAERKVADIALRRCVSAKGQPFIAWTMYMGVRMGGVWWLPTSFRWGFGWNYPESGPPGKTY